MCCGLSPRALLILISSWAILQSIVYLVFSIIGILIRNCSFSMEGSKFNYLLYLTYFRDGSCGNINWEVLGISGAEGPTENPQVTEVFSRTGDFLLAYLVLSCVWIVSSMSLIVATFTPCMSLLCLKLFSFPWVVTCVAVLIMDVVATVFHIIDISNTTDLEGFLSFIGFVNINEIIPKFDTVPAYLLPMPSVTMMLVAIRGVLLWAVNLSCLIYVIRGVRKMLRNELMKKNKPIRPDFGYEREYNRPETNSPHSIEDTPSQMAEISRYNDPSLTNQYQYDNNGYTPEPMQQPQQQQQAQIPPNRYVASGGNYVFVSEKRFMEPLKGGGSVGIGPRSDDGMSGMSSRLSNARSLDSVDDAGSRASSNIGARSHTSDRTTDYENDIATPVERLSYLSGDSMFTENNNNHQRRSQGGRSQQEAPPVLVKPSMIKQHVQQHHQHPQYMRQHQQIREEELPHARTSYQAPPSELRSQLPWSYFEDRDHMKGPQKQRYDDELLPPVPVPDYTLHFQKKKERPQTKPKPTRAMAPAPPPHTNGGGSPEDNTESNPNERWSGPEYTY